LLELPGGASRLFFGDADLSRWLLYPIGADSDGNVYGWQFGEIARIDAGGHVRVAASIDTLVVNSARNIVYAGFFRPTGHDLPIVEVTRHQPGGSPLRLDLAIPEGHAKRPGDWRLVHVETEERYHVFGGESPGAAGILLIYSASGRLEEEMQAAGGMPRLESRLAAYSHWQVDDSGRLYLPVADSEGCVIARLTI
jgi:hypothetical protein